MNRRKKVGIMGGTFNPVHIAHLILAENAYHAYDLDEIMMLPNGDPPHKADMKTLSAHHRLAMLKLAVKDIPYFHISEMELHRDGYSYSSVTLEELTQTHPDTDYYFIMGADSVFQIETWNRPEIVMQKCIILAATRDHTPKAALSAQIEHLHNKYNADIRLLDVPDFELSSSELRKRIQSNQSIRFMVPETVREYIEQYQLYL